MIRPAEHLVHRGTVAVIDGRICDMLNKLVGLDKLRAHVRGQDAQLDQALLAIRLAGISYTESSAAGTAMAAQPEPVSQSHQQLNDTVSTTTAAAILGLTDRAVRKAINEKRLPAATLDGRYRITQNDLATYIATTQNTGRTQ